MPPENLIPIDKLNNGFESFLKINDNKRIFFSGRFGIGKTYFLKEFFNSHKDHYDVYHLFPVRYQINKNENIIDLLKYDILVELLNKNKDAFSTQKVKGLSERIKLFLSFCKEKGSINAFLQSVIGTGQDLASLSPDPLTQFLSKLGRPLQDLLNVDKEFQEFKKEFEAGEKGLVDNFIKEVQGRDVQETDYLSYLLSEKIVQQKVTRKSVLVLDDMDRVDPEHVFRILNVFSAHLDDEDNKFKFDYVIIVGDIKNLQSVFCHKYGKGTDFWGYFDKFFTVRPFYLDNARVIAERIPELVKQIKCDEPSLHASIGESGYIKLLLTEILNRALNINRLNLRELYKPIRHNFVELKSGTFANSIFNSNQFEQIFDIGIKLLIAIFGGDDSTFLGLLGDIKESIEDADNNSRAPYDVYVGAIMKRLLPNSKPGIKTNWNGYSFTIPDPNSRACQLDGTKAQQARFFYEAMGTYISQSKHKKNSNYDYER